MPDLFFSIDKQVKILVSDYLPETDELIFLVRNPEGEVREKLPKNFLQDNKLYKLEITSVEDKSLQDLPHKYFSDFRKEPLFLVQSYEAKTLIRACPEKEKINS